MRKEEPNCGQPPVERRGLPGVAAVHGLARDHHVEALRRLVVGLQKGRVAVPVPVPGERLVEPVPLGQKNERLHRRVAREEAVGVSVVGDAVDDVARRAREQAAQADGEGRGRRELDVRAVPALAVVVRADLEVSRDGHHLAAQLVLGERERDAVLLGRVEVGAREGPRPERVLDHPDPERERDSPRADEPAAVLVELHAEPVLARDQVVGGVVGEGRGEIPLRRVPEVPRDPQATELHVRREIRAHRDQLLLDRRPRDLVAEEPLAEVAPEPELRGRGARPHRKPLVLSASPDSAPCA